MLTLIFIQISFALACKVSEPEPKSTVSVTPTEVSTTIKATPEPLTCPVLDSGTIFDGPIKKPEYYFKITNPYPTGSLGRFTEIPDEEWFQLCLNSSFAEDFKSLSVNQKPKQKMTIHAIAFDLATLKWITKRNITEEVTIQADTVYTTSDLDVFYNLTIWARRIQVAVVPTEPGDKLKTVYKNIGKY